MNIYDLGILLTGESGSGKSETALALLDRGHQLIADDIVTFTLQNDQTLLGTCPEPLQDLLEIRGVGIFNVANLFGKKAIMNKQRLSLIIHFDKTENMNRKTDDRINEFKSIPIQGDGDVQIPYIALPYSKERRFELLVETLARHHIQQNLIPIEPQSNEYTQGARS